MSSPDIVPGYYSYVANEASTEEAQQKLNENNHALRNICYSTLYSFLNSPDQFYHLSLNRFVRAVRQQCIQHHIPTFNIDKSIIYFYNRQFFIQLISTPQVFPGQNISIPLSKTPNNEIQVDILQFSEDQRISNFNMGYLVVIEEPFSRFLWAYPTAAIDSAKVRKAFFLAFSRPGVGHHFYSFLRDKVQRIVVDGGSEFKDSFRGNFHQAFPNAQLLISDPKRKTMGRTTSTGAVEAGIGTLRRVFRDHELGVHRQFLAAHQFGLGQALDAYNQMEQADTLKHSSPQQVAMACMGRGDSNLIPQLNSYMQSKQQLKYEKKQQVFTKYGIANQNMVFRDKHGMFAYRVFLPPPAFAKAVTIRVTKEAYVISQIRDSMHVDLIEYGNGNKTQQNVNVKQLVLVKAPIDMGPEKIVENLISQVEALRVRHTPREVSLAFDMTPEIVQAVGAPHLHDLEHQRLDHNPLVRAPRPRRLPQHLEQYQVAMG